MTELATAPNTKELGQPGPAEKRRRTRLPALIWLAGAVAAVIVALMLIGTWITPFDPTRQDLMNTAAGPGGGHVLGTDSLGRDVLSLLLAGARTAVIGPLLVATGTAFLGASLGMVAGWRGGFVDSFMSRVADLMYALPGLLVIIIVVGVLDGGYWLAVVVLTVLSIPTAFRMTRSVAAAQARMPYIEAARTLGLPVPRILLRHILPNIFPTVLATFLLDFVAVLIALSGLSFLGLGAPPGTPDWGTLLQDGQSMLTVNPWVSLAPALLILSTAISVTLLGDWMYDRYSTRGSQR
ncbi:ABC transporter permease [Streptomyces sp. NBC_01445]|uniref:ABC transporter permease n=1 Tax=Streptomyces sp. NBC_01445 TaxID=2903869 RepID=UPI002DD9C6F8|nr:ABC transporter permease [Streptomyces sp. NBC_01445]WSE11261.1 ABC transporter permease [Streptomyces sp. NBC_01445]